MFRSLAIVGSIAFTCASPATSSTITGQFGGSFSEPNGQTSSAFVYDGSGSETLRWGTPSGSSQSIETGNTSELSIGSSSFSHTPTANGEYLLGTISWVNQSNWHSGGTWGSTMTLDLSVNTANGINSQSIPVSFSVYNSIDQAFDTGTNEITGNNPDEISGFVLSDGAFSSPIDLGNGWIFSDLLFRLDDAGTAGSDVITASGQTLTGTDFGSEYNSDTGFWKTREGTSGTIGVYASLTAVPLPAALWFLLSGLASAIMVGRRKATAI